MVSVVVNGQPYDFEEPVLVPAILAALGVEDRGVAVAVDSQILPCQQWSEPIVQGSKVEIVQAFQGG